MKQTDERMIPEHADQDTFWEHINRYRFASKWVFNKKVLDIACGEGYGSGALLKAGASNVIGVDISEEACSHAANKYGIDARVGNAESIPIKSGSVDVVVSFETIEHVSNPELFLNEIARVLSESGVLIISTPDKNLYSPPGKEPNPFHCSELTPLEFDSLLSLSFTSIKLFGQRPASARWWSPLSLIAESSFLEQVKGGARLRRILWNKWSQRRISPVSELDRSDPVSCILRNDRFILNFFDWSSVRPLSRLNGWNPVFLVAVAQKRPS